MPTHPLVLTAVLVLALSALVAGCGGDDGEVAGSGGGGAPGNGAQTTDESGGSDGGSAGGAEEGGNGTGGSDGAEAEGIASKPEFIARADAICRRAGKRILAETIAYFTPQGIDAATPEEFQEFVDDVFAPNIEAQVSDIEALGPPPGDSEEVEAVLAAMQALADSASDDPQGSVEGNPFVESQPLARKYGFKACGSPP